MTNGEGNGKPLQYSCLENPMDGGAWWAAVHGVATSWTRLSDFTFTFHFHTMEKAMATHSSVLAWRIPGTAEPGGLPSMGLHRAGHDWSDLAAAVIMTKKQKVTSQMKGQDKSPSPKIKWSRDRQLPEKELRIIIVKMIQDLRKRMEAKIEKI